MIKVEIDKNLINRINELAKKKKNEGLTPEEIVEQKSLREQYLKLFKAGFKQQVESIKVVGEWGNGVTPKKIKELREQ